PDPQLVLPTRVRLVAAESAGPAGRGVAGMTPERVEAGARGHVPDLGGPVPATTHQPFAVGAPAQGGDAVGVIALERADPGTAGHVPELDGVFFPRLLPLV